MNVFSTNHPEPSSRTVDGGTVGTHRVTAIAPTVPICVIANYPAITR